MTDFTPTRKLARRRERKGVKTACNTIRRIHNTQGIDGVEGIVDAIGAGDAEDWNHDSTEGQGDE